MLPLWRNTCKTVVWLGIDKIHISCLNMWFKMFRHRPFTKGARHGYEEEH